MPVTVHLTERFVSDLDEVEEYSRRQWGRRIAAKYVDDIIAAIDRIESSPKILRLEPDLAPDLYFYRMKKHILVCDLRDDQVVILSLIHTSMDLPSRLAELVPRIVAEVQMLGTRGRRKLDE